MGKEGGKIRKKKKKRGHTFTGTTIYVFGQTNRTTITAVLMFLPNRRKTKYSSVT